MAKKMGRINESRINYKKLDTLLKSLNKDVSIRVGIIGDKAGEIHPDTDLTNAQLGAIHEFGANIKVTDKMRNYLHSQGLHLRKSTEEVNIPARSFLVEPLLSPEGKKAVKQEFMKSAKSSLSRDNELNLLAWGGDEKMIETFAIAFGAAAFKRVQEAFTTGGFGEWQNISTYTREHRKGAADNPPLTDTGDLRDAISFDVKVE